MAEQSPRPESYLPDEQVILPDVRHQTTNEAVNKERYLEALRTQEYIAVVTDLDGVFIRNEYYNEVGPDGVEARKNGRVDQEAFDALMAATLLNPAGRVPLSIASGRTVGEIGEIILPEVEKALKASNVPKLEVGDLTVFASNAAVGYDGATLDVLYASPLDDVEIDERLFELDEFKAFRKIMELQSQMVDAEGKQAIGRAKVIRDAYTYTIGINPAKLDLVAALGEDGRRAVEEFRRYFGEPRDILTVVQRLNQVFADRSVALNATTSGSMVDINSIGISKQLAIDVTRQIVAARTGRKLSDVDPATVLSIGDSVYGNDEALTQRPGGFTNIRRFVPGSEYPIYIDEEGDQFHKVAQLLSLVTIKPLEDRSNIAANIEEDYIASKTEVMRGMPGKPLEDEFDVSGSQVVTIEAARAILRDATIPLEARMFFARHSGIRIEDDKVTVFTRGKEYYEASFRAENVDLLTRMQTVDGILFRFNIPPDREPTQNERLVILSLLDHGKAYLYRMLNTELEGENLRTDGGESIRTYMELAQNYTYNYYAALLGAPMKLLLTASFPSTNVLPSPERREFIHMIREMDHSIEILKQVNYITDRMIRTGQQYDYVLCPFYGASELGFALRAVMEIKSMDHIPTVVPVRFSGAKSRGEIRQKNVFPDAVEHAIVGKSVLVMDDNSGTGVTLRKLKREVSRYSPSTLDAAVVQIGTATRVKRVLSGEKRNFNRAIINPEDLAYKGVQVYNLKEGVKKAEQLMHNVTLDEYVNRFKL